MARIRPGGTQRFTAAEKRALKERMVELRAEGRTIAAIAAELGINRRTINDWRQKDEALAVAWAAAEGDYRDFWVEKAREYALDGSKPLQAQMIMFMVKQADPSFRDNHKVEHVVSGGLQSALKQLAKMGRSA